MVALKRNESIMPTAANNPKSETGCMSEIIKEPNPMAVVTFDRRTAGNTSRIVSRTAARRSPMSASSDWIRKTM